MGYQEDDMGQRATPNAAPRLSTKEVGGHILFGRAVEAVIWGMPVVNYDLMFQEMKRKVKGDHNQILYWSRLLDWTNQTLTPNPDVIYLMPFFNMTDVGPLVLDVPPADDGVLNGSIMNRWQAAIEDIGPGGVDKGKGGKYLILPPGYDMERIPNGYIPAPSDCCLGYALIRSVLKHGGEEDVAKALAYAKRVKLYPLSQADNPPPTKYVDAADVIFDSTIQYDLRFFVSLHRMIMAEPWLERDKAMIDPLRSIGIDRDAPFAPDAKAKQILEQAIQEAKVYLDSIYEALPPYYEGGRWFFPISNEMAQSVRTFWREPDSYPTDNRGMAYSIAFFSALHLGESQYYLMSTTDKDGRPFKGNALYRLTVPARAPVTQYWSMTVYDRETHTFIRSARCVGRSSQTPGMRWNADGSAGIYFGVKPPAGGESNWIPTDPDGRFEVLARFYGPQKALFDKTWKLPDIEKLPPRSVQ
jgi:hypothetical protein